MFLQCNCWICFCKQSCNGVIANILQSAAKETAPAPNWLCHVRWLKHPPQTRGTIQLVCLLEGIWTVSLTKAHAGEVTGFRCSAPRWKFIEMKVAKTQNHRMSHLCRSTVTQPKHQCYCKFSCIKLLLVEQVEVLLNCHLHTKCELKS